MEIMLYVSFVVERPTSLPPLKDMYDFSELLRIKFYSDTERGYGDNGSFKYVRVSKEDFDTITYERRDGSTYIKYIPNDALVERLKGVGYNGYGMGYEFATEEEYNEELTKLREKLERLESIC
jgi:hypothetical protein